MAKCILHVGMHKTGTTSIQNSLQDLDDDQFYYTRLQGKPNHSTTIEAIFHADKHSHIARKLAKYGKISASRLANLARPDLDASVAEAKGRTLVISGEGILRMSESELNSLKYYLVDHGYDDIEVAAYARAPVAYISSAMQQKLKIGKTRAFKIESCFPEYREKFKKFDTVFGAGNLRLFKYDPANFPNGDVVEDFCRHFGIPLGSVNPIRKNVSITRLAAQLRFQYTKYAEAEGLPPLRGAMGMKLLDRIRSPDPARFQLAPSVIAPFLPEIQADVEWMEKRLGKSLAEPELRDQDGDIRSIDDLLAPVPGINEKLCGLLSEAGATVHPADAENTMRLLSQVARIGTSGGGDAEAKALRKAKRLLAGGDKASRLPGASDDSMAQRKARRREVEGAADAAGEGHGARSRAGRRGERHHGGAGLGEARGGGRETAREERQRKRDERILALAQAIAAANAENAAPRAARMGGGAGANLLGQGPRAGRMGGPGQAMGQGQGMGQGRRQGQDMGAGQQAGGGAHQAGGPGRKGQGAGRKGGAQLKPTKEVLQMPRANARPGAPERPRRQNLTPIATTPTPLLNIDKNLAVLWSPKSACTTVYVWFSHISGFSRDVKEYASWPHRHRMEQYSKSDIYAESAANGMAGATLLRIIRDPYSRAVSIYRHALNTLFADKEMELYSNGTISAVEGYSFQTFLDMAAALDMRRANVHFRPQIHLYESQRKPDRVINISKQDLFTELNAFEAEVGLPKTNFADLDWLHDLEKKRKAKQEPMEGEAIDTTAFSRRQVKELGQFPDYGQLLTPEARQKIEAIYKSDFDAYRDYL